ncbi:MAG: hypothetical protein JO011_07185 [Ktedonobacteraceae bacterium]|nr:hypothetical protein [Ktedonobacteraceae bacterium]
MSNASANDLERVANDLTQIAKQYTYGSQELDQHVITLEGAVSHVLSSGTQGWKGLSSEAFLSAWLERKARLQQASILMSEAASYLTTMARTIEDNVPLIRAEQSIQLQAVFQSMSSNDQQTILDGESQAQNAILMALATLNSQLEALAEEISDCPEADRDAGDPTYYDNISRNDADGSGSGAKAPEERIKDAIADPVVAQELIALANLQGVNLEDVANLLEKGIDPGAVAQLINDGTDLKAVAADAQTLLNGGVKVELVNGWLTNETRLKDAIVIMNQGVDLNLLGSSDKLGDFTGLENASVNEIVSRIPKGAKILTWIPDPPGTGIQDGIKFQWTDDNGVEWNIRMHGPNLNAPAGSHSAAGWVMRVMRADTYMDATGNFYPLKEVVERNPDGTPNPEFKEPSMRKTHIPVQKP